jgi:hypothetical protein
MTLCRVCELEEFMVPGGWGFRLGLGAGPLPINALQLVRVLPAPGIGKDMVCPQCNLRLVFLRIVSELSE